jgi:hypothetical protein
MRKAVEEEEEEKMTGVAINTDHSLEPHTEAQSSY